MRTEKAGAADTDQTRTCLRRLKLCLSDPSLLQLLCVCRAPVVVAFLFVAVVYSLFCLVVCWRVEVFS